MSTAPILEPLETGGVLSASVRLEEEEVPYRTQYNSGSYVNEGTRKWTVTLSWSRVGRGVVRLRGGAGTDGPRKCKNRHYNITPPSYTHAPPPSLTCYSDVDCVGASDDIISGCHIQTAHTRVTIVTRLG